MSQEPCAHCAAGDKPLALKRQYIHRIGWRNVICTEAGLHAEPGAWADIHNPREWTPRRLRPKV